MTVELELRQSLHLGTGIHDIDAATYHSDQLADTPSLSSSLASLLCSASPAHARAAHPRLNAAHTREERDIYDLGNVVHQILLEGNSDCVVVVDAKDWRTKAAQEERDAVRAAGRIPLLIDKLADVEAMVAAARDQLAAHTATPPLFTDGKPEQTLIWEEPGGVVCRARVDWLRDDHLACDDLKTTGRSADPAAYSRALFGVGGDVQAAFYLRGLKKLTGVSAQWRWVIVETSPPYALSVVSPGPDVLTIGEKKVAFAIERWRRCLESGRWPGFPVEVCFAELPAYEEARWLAKEEREAA